MKEVRDEENGQPRQRIQPDTRRFQDEGTSSQRSLPGVTPTPPMPAGSSFGRNQEASNYVDLEWYI